jgi:predicted nucleic acid-binding protein
LDWPALLIALDTNLLVYAHRTEAPEHRAATAAMEQAARGPWGLPFPVVAEFWTVVTSRAAGPRPASPKEAGAFLDDLWSAGARPLLPSLQLAIEVGQWARKLEVRGPRIFDLQIGLIALENGARELWTHDAGFVAVPGLKVRDPLRR